MLGVEERGMRRTLLYASITRDADNNADGELEAAYFLPILFSVPATSLFMLSLCFQIMRTATTTPMPT